MNRNELKQYFGIPGPAVLPVIHVLEHAQTSRNIICAEQQGVAGVFLINHDFDVETFLPIVKSVRKAHPDIWLGLNFLAITGKNAFPVLVKLGKDGIRIDGYWADDSRIDENRAPDDQPEASEILEIKNSCEWDGLYFGGTAFKKQREVNEKDHLVCAQIGSLYMDVVTTSGIATGQEAGIRKIDVFRQGVGKSALALASGITPENISRYVEYLDAILVATGINFDGDFYNIDESRLRKLLRRIDK